MHRSGRCRLCREVSSLSYFSQRKNSRPQHFRRQLLLHLFHDYQVTAIVIARVSARPNINLLGDGLGDLTMKDGVRFETCLSIGFYNHLDNGLLQKYMLVESCELNLDIFFSGCRLCCSSTTILSNYIEASVAPLNVIYYSTCLFFFSNE